MDKLIFYCLNDAVKSWGILQQDMKSGQVVKVLSRWLGVSAIIQAIYKMENSE